VQSSPPDCPLSIVLKVSAFYAPQCNWGAFSLQKVRLAREAQ
jgi:hypothetical protein